jgi:uncharacterized protein YprB with RNaseH-like and TPR domain
MSRYDKIIQRFSRKLSELEEEIRQEQFSKTRDKEKRSEPASPFAYRLTEDEYYQALELKRELVERYENQPLNGVISGEKISNQHGTFYHISEEIKEDSFKSEKETVEKTILSFFSLLPGIREYREEQLKRADYKNLQDLISHPRWGKEAEFVLKIVFDQDKLELQNLLSSRLPKSHPLIFSLSSFHPWEDFLFLDIETLGLFGGNLVILIGIATLEDGKKTRLDQFLALEVEEEIGLLKAFSDYLTKSKSLVSFNGKAFDVPFLEGRLRYYGIIPDLHKPHFDLLHFSRRIWRNQLPDFCLDTIERNILKEKRSTHLPSSLVPEFYSDYLRTKNYGLLKPIVEHNRQDVLTLVRIFSELHRCTTA